MRGTKKLLAFTICIALVLGLAACGGSTAPTPGNTPDSGSDAKQEWPATTIEYWHINNETQGGAVVEEMIAKFNANNGKNITVISKFVPNQYGGITQELQTSLASGIYPGVIQAGFAYMNYYAENFPQFTSPEEIIERYAPEDAGYLENHFADGMLALSTAANGRLIGIPYSASVPMLYINEDLFIAAGLDPKVPPTTLEEVVEYGRKIKEATGEHGFYVQAPADTWINSPMAIGNGATMFKMVDGKAVPTFDSPETIEVWQLLQDAYKEGISVNIPWEDGTGAFVGGKFGMCITTVARKSYFEQNAAFKLGSAYFPASAKGKEPKVCVGGNMLMVFGKTDAEIKACWEFLKYLYQEENAVHWTIETGYLTAAVLASEPGKNNPQLKEFLSKDALMTTAFNSLSFAIPNVSWPGANGLQVETILVNMRDSILSNFENVPQAVKTASDKIAALLS